MAEGLGFGRRRLIDRIIQQNWEVVPEEKTFNYNELLFVVQELLTEEGKQVFEKRMSARGHNIFREFTKHLLYRNIANYDSMILLTAEKGTGKSSAAIMLAREWCRLLGIQFNPARHIAYNNADVMQKIDMLNKFEPIICDEAIRFASACIVGDTLIKTPKGDIKIKELVGKEMLEVYSYNEKTKQQEIQKAERCIYTGKKEVFEVELENGQKIQATKEHKFLTNNGWKTLEELKEGDDLVDI